MHALKLRREVTSLRHDLDGIRSMMQNMHREVSLLFRVMFFERWCLQYLVLGILRFALYRVTCNAEDLLEYATQVFWHPRLV